MRFRSSGPIFDECQTSYWSGSRPMPQPRMIASNRFFLMYSLRNDAHSMTWMSTRTPRSLSDAWTISATLRRSSLPWLVRSTNSNGWPSLTRIPSAFCCRRPAPEAEAHTVDQLALVDGVGERLADPPVGEPRITEVEPEVRVHVVLILELVVGLAERREVGLALELQRGEPGRARRIDALGLQLEEDGRLARDDPVDDARKVGPPLEVVGVRDEHHLLAGLPLAKAVRARADRVRSVLRGLAQPPVSHVALQQVAWQDPCGPALERLGVRLLVTHIERERVHRLDRVDRAEVLAVGGRCLGVDHRLVREDDVIGGEGASVVPSNVSAQPKGEIETVPAEVPGLGQLADDVEVLVPGDETAVDQRPDLERRGVGQHVRNQARDVTGQRVDEGVPVYRLARRLTGHAIHRAVRLAPASGQREHDKQPEEAQRIAPAHAVNAAGSTGRGIRASRASAAPPGRWARAPPERRAWSPPARARSTAAGRPPARRSSPARRPEWRV